MRPLFPREPAGRAIIRVAVERVSDSCGYGVPVYRFERERAQLADWSERKGPRGLEDYQRKNNVTSLDGLPGVTWVRE